MVSGVIRLAERRDLLAWTRWRYRSTDEDKLWDWRAILSECQSSGGSHECYAALSMGELQALMVLDLHQTLARAGGVVVDYLSTSPSNRTKQSGLKNIGTALIAIAVVRSLELGGEGRLWLESLPGAEAFYDSIGMIRQALRSREGHTIYIMEEDASKEFLEEIRKRGIITL